MPEFVVRIPQETVSYGPVFITGNLPELGNWRPDAVRLEPWGDSSFRKKIQLDSNNKPAEFLFTRGNWRSAETDQEGKELEPRNIIDPVSRIDVKVLGWGRKAVDYHRDFKSKFLNLPRTIIVYLPPGYDLNPNQRYPVMYLQDGQNIFDAETSFNGVPWGCGEIAERVARNNEASPIILVGIENTADRNREYAPRENTNKRTQKLDLSRQYGRFIVQELKPWIDEKYRTMPEARHTAIGGSSLGGLISLHLAQWYPDIFGLCAAMSPSLWWDHEYFLRTLNASPGWLDIVRIWLDVGGKEGHTRTTQLNTTRRVRRLASILKMQGRAEGVDYRYLELPEGMHHESAWGDRFDQVLKFLYGKDRS